MVNNITISIITATFNSENVIEKTVASVLMQDYEHFEHIIIDNCSSDKTLELVTEIYKKASKESHLVIVSEKDTGIANAFNKGIKRATGEVILLLNADDELTSPHQLSDTAKVFKNPDILFSHGSIQFLDAQHGSNIRRPLLCEITEGGPYHHPGMFFRKTVYETHGMYDESYRYSMDYEMFARLEKQIVNFRKRGHQFIEYPVAIMRAGGASYKQGVASVHEAKRLLQQHNYWGIKAWWHYTLRLTREYLKQLLDVLGLNLLVRIWRKFKWSQVNR